MTQGTPQRKVEHVKVALDGIETTSGARWEEIQLVHNCLPELDRKDIDVSMEFLGTSLQAPIVIASMTGGHEETKEINRRLATAAEKLGIAMGVGSMRAAIEQPKLLSTYTVARKAAPNTFLMANIGVPQLIRQDKRQPCTIEQIQDLISALSANALILHLNFLQEACQPEGDTNSRGCSEAIREICSAIDTPIIAKETGSGISREDAFRLLELGVRAIDIGGYGGSNMALLESKRAQMYNDIGLQRIGETFGNWGIHTPIAIVEAKQSGLPIICTGGIRSGLDAAKAINLGADLVSIGRPALTQAQVSTDALVLWLQGLIEELKVAMFLTGSANLCQLRCRPRRIFGYTAEWLRQSATNFELRTLRTTSVQ